MPDKIKLVRPIAVELLEKDKSKLRTLFSLILSKSDVSWSSNTRFIKLLWYLNELSLKLELVVYKV